MRMELLSREELEKDGLPSKPGYGQGIGLDLRAFLTESNHAKEILNQLDQRERFVLLGYFVLRKTEQQVAMILGMSEFRLNLFLKIATKKLGALVALQEEGVEAWEKVLEREGLAKIRVRGMRGKTTRAEGKTKEVRLLDCLGLFKGTGSFLKTGEVLGAYYVDVRRGLEEVGEKLRGKRGLAEVALGELINAAVQFASVRGEGYAGKAGRTNDVLRVQDPEILGESTVNLEAGVEGIFVPRAVGSSKNGGEDNETSGTTEEIAN